MAGQSFGAQVRLQRQQRGLSLDGLAGRVGISRATLSKVERGERMPSLSAAVSIADVLGIALPTLLDGGTAATPDVMTDESPLTYVDDDTGIRRETLFRAADGVEVVRYLLPEGTTAGPFHPHSPGTRELFVVVTGDVQVNAGTHSVPVSTGGVVSTPGDVSHHVANTGAGTAELVLTIIQDLPGIESHVP